MGPAERPCHEMEAVRPVSQPDSLVDGWKQDRRDRIRRAQREPSTVEISHVARCPPMVAQLAT
jgi:hypothetical protein